jgi:hypothetical protein
MSMKITFEYVKAALRRWQISGLLTGVAIIFTGCGPDERILRSGNSEPAASNIERRAPKIADDIEAMRTADFEFIYVLRRKDGGVIDAEDRSVIRVNTSEANRRVSAEDGKAFLIGSNTKLTPKNMMALYERFAVENYSKPEPTEISNSAGAK